MAIYQNLECLVGNTPIVKLQHFDTGCCELFVKLENMNPGGSIKDRIALGMVEAAEQEGRLKPGGTLVEATAGNTGLALAQTAILKGYRLIVVVPDKMSQEKIAHLTAVGAKVVLTRSDVCKGHPDYYQDLAEHIAADLSNAVYVNQFANVANPLAHEKTTAVEIWQQMEQNVDAIVCGVGTGGHLTGIGRFMRQHAPHVAMILGDPYGSVLADYVTTGTLGAKKNSWFVEGIGQDFIPETCDLSLARQAFSVNDAEAFQTARDLLRKESIFGGSSTGTVVHAALQYCRLQTTPKRVLTFVYDSGNKYLSKMYNDAWMREKGFALETIA